MDENCCICGTVKNCGKYLEKVLKNIETIGSLFSNFKIIISYDISSDNSLEILQTYQQLNPNLMILHVNCTYIVNIISRKLATNV
jgi:glycosyltransferase involved in cell wall biosynthesis